MGKKKKKVPITWILCRGLQKDFWTLRQRTKLSMYVISCHRIRTKVSTGQLRQNYNVYFKPQIFLFSVKLKIKPDLTLHDKMMTASISDLNILYAALFKLLSYMTF